MCVECGYDLSGLDNRIFAICPECGSKIDPNATTVLLERASARRWKHVFLSPIYALPGVLLLVVGQPVLSFVMAAVFAYRAMSMDDAIERREASAILRATQAVMLAIAWTTFSSGVLAMIVMGIVAVVAPGW